VQALDPSEPRGQRRLHHDWKRCDPIPLSLGVPDDDPIRPELDVFDAHHAQALQEAQAGAVEKQRRQTAHPVESRDQRADLGPCEHRWKPPGSLRADDVGDRRERLLEDVPIEKENRGESLVLRGGAHALADGEIRQERIDLGLPHGLRVTLAVKEHEPLHPADVRLFRPQAVMPRPHGEAYAIQQTWRAARGVDQRSGTCLRFGTRRLAPSTDLSE